MMRGPAIVAVALVALFFAAPALAAGGIPLEGRTSMTTDVRDKATDHGLDAAITAARAGNWQPLQALDAAPAVIVDALVPMADAADAHRRFELVGYLTGLSHPATAPVLARLLSDTDTEIRTRSAAALYALPDPAAALASAPGAAEALLADLADGAPSAAQLLLLAYIDTPEADRALRRIVEDEDAADVKLQPWGRPVPAAMAATVALSRRGDQTARDALLLREINQPAEEMAFLLSALRTIDAPAVLQHLARLSLDDTREVGGGVPSGAMPGRRVCDLAVDAFAERLRLALPYPLNPAGRYEPAQRRFVDDAIRDALPR